MKRRDFLKIAGLAFCSQPFARVLNLFDNENALHIFHTNDTHSHIDPFPMSDKRNGGKGGIARRATLFNKMRKIYKNTLFFDAGDVFQGTPYFNYYEGKLNYQLMSKLKYTATTLGNHDFDNGVYKLFEAMKYANFDIISSNYNFENSPLKNKVLPYKIYNKAGIKIGVFGLGVDFKGLVTDNNHVGVTYSNPVPVAKLMADKLRNTEKCNVVICLSHLGLEEYEGKPGDISVAQLVDGIDLIIGGHSHSFLDSPLHVTNNSGWTTVINQVGFAGLFVGHIMLDFDRKQYVKNIVGNNIEVV
jgi:5'-nucleotidase